MLTRKEFESGLFKINQIVYLKYGAKPPYTPELAVAVVELLLLEYPKIFQVKPKNYAKAFPEITSLIPAIISKNHSVYDVAMLLFVVVTGNLSDNYTVFYIKALYWFLTTRRIRVVNFQAFENMKS